MKDSSFSLAYGDVLSFRSTFQSGKKKTKTTYEKREFDWRAPAHLQLLIARSHVSPQSVRTEPQVVNAQIDPTNQGEQMVNLPSEGRYLQVLQATNAPSITDSTHVQVTPQYHVPENKSEEDASVTNGFGMDEIEKFFRENPQVVEQGIDSTVNLIGESQILLDLNDAFFEYKRTNQKLKHVVVQRSKFIFGNTFLPELRFNST